MIEIIDGYMVEKADVLIIGAGIAGMKAAITLSDMGIEAILVSKGPLTRSGISPLGFTGLTAYISQYAEDSTDRHFSDTVIAGKYLSNQKLVRIMTEMGSKVVDELIGYGLVFEKGRDGRFVQLKFPGMSAPRMLRVKGGGASLVRCLAREVRKRPRIVVWEDTVILDLVLNSDRVVGAIALSLRNSNGIFFTSRATILATGGCGLLWPYSDCPPCSTGDGYALALRVGAAIIDMEQQLFYPTVAISPPCIKGLEISYEHFSVPCARMIDESGHPVIFFTKTLPTRDEFAREIYEEIQRRASTSNRGLFIDVSECRESDRKQIAESLPAQRRLKEFGIDFTRQPLEVAPAAHTTLGGVKIDERGQTSVAGLFACGEVSGNVHGANRLAGNAYLETQVFGTLGAQGAVTYSQETDFFIPSRNDIRELFFSSLSFIKEGGKYRAWELKRKIQDVMWQGMGLIRNREDIRITLNDIQRMREEDFPRLSIARIKGYNLDLIECLEVRNMLAVAEIAARSAFHREETRGTHFRQDFPEMNNRRWLRHTLVQIVNGALHVGDIPVEIDGLLPKEVQNEC